MANDYDSFAEAYTAATEANLINGYYMRPAIVNLADRGIVDVGCGSGTIAAALRDGQAAGRRRGPDQRAGTWSIAVAIA